MYNTKNKYAMSQTSLLVRLMPHAKRYQKHTIYLRRKQFNTLWWIIFNSRILQNIKSQIMSPSCHCERLKGSVSERTCHGRARMCPGDEVPRQSQFTSRLLRHDVPRNDNLLGNNCLEIYKNLINLSGTEKCSSTITC